MLPFERGITARFRSGSCACGSRRPFASCCLRWHAGLDRVLARLAAFAEQPEIRLIQQRAAAEFGAHAEDSPAFWEWCLCDYEAAELRGSVLGWYADLETDLSLEEQTALTAALFTPLRPYEVLEAPASAVLVVKDLLSGSELSVGPLGIPGGIIRSDVVVARPVSIGQLRRPLVCWLAFPPGTHTDLLAYIRGAYQMLHTGRHLALEDFADGNATLYHAFGSEQGRGVRILPTARMEPWAPASLMYRCTAAARIQAALDRQPALERSHDPGAEGRVYRWDGPAGSMGGTIVLNDDTLTASADTRTDRARIRDLLETCLRGMTDFVAERPVAGGPPSPGRISPPAGHLFLERVLTTWPDRVAPELNGQTPREACATQRGQEAVVRLLLNLERDLARQKRLGRAWADAGEIWERLGLTRPPILRNQQSPPRAVVPPRRARRSGPQRRGKPKPRS